jgi:acetyl esterase/lipase
MKSIFTSVILGIIVCLTPSARAADDVEIVPDVVYGHKDGLAMTFDVVKPKEHANGAGVLFMVSGGFYSVSYPPENNATMFHSLLQKGFTMFIVRHGSSPKYVIPECVDDVRRSVRYIRKNAARFGVDPERLGVTGGSAGGFLSLMLGETGDDGDPQAKDELLCVSDRVAAVVAYFPPTDIRPWVVPTSSYYQNYPALRFDATKADAYSPVLLVKPDNAPTLLIHGDRDTLVPLDHSEKILAEFQKNQVASDLLVIKGGEHGFQGDDAHRADAARDAWFEQHLLKQKEKPADKPAAPAKNRSAA